MSDIIDFSKEAFDAELKRMRSLNPLVHCMTNNVVQEITANVLLAAGASPAMVIDKHETAQFAAVASALLINVGTLTDTAIGAMELAIESANNAGKPWVLDPVGAGGLTYRTEFVKRLVSTLKPAVIRGNGSEILAVAGVGAGGKGVDSTDSSLSALNAAKELARKSGAVVCVTGEVDYITDGNKTVSVSGGDVMTTLVVGTGCSLSALVAAFAAGAEDLVASTASACKLAKCASEYAISIAKGPGTFHDAYLDGLYLTGR